MTNEKPSSMVFLPGEVAMGWGLMFLAATISMNRFVMGFFLAAALAPGALLFLARGIGRCREPGRFSWRQCAGFAMWVLGIVTLAVAADGGAMLSYRVAMESAGRVVPAEGPMILGSGIWASAALILAAAVGFLAAALALWTDWPPSRQRKWLLIFLLFPMVTFLVHQLLKALGGPLTA